MLHLRHRRDSTPATTKWRNKDIFVGAVIVFSCFVSVAQAQSANATTTLNEEVQALNAIFSKWKIAADSNISGEVCSGAAIEEDIFDLGSQPSIRCDCSHVEDKRICHITSLDLSKNYLTGSLPTAIENLTRLESLNLETNALSGELPKELGKLAKLRVLNIGTNNFSGSLPFELGKLVKLNVLIMDSCGIKGPIPSTIKSLKHLLILWASDMELTGRIPDFIGNFAKLQSLRFLGTSLEGPSLECLRPLNLEAVKNEGLDQLRDLEE